MRKNIVVLFGNLFFLLFQSCSSTQPAVTTQLSHRTIILNEKKITEDNLGGFTSWICGDFSKDGPVRVEVGFFGKPAFKDAGFILFDGGLTGELTHYRRAGLEHRWDWGPNKSDYSFVLQTDGTGLYYDFTTVDKGKTTKPRSLYKCRKR